MKTLFPHITSDPEILGGKPCIKGTRISVSQILEWIASGASIDEIAEAYPHLPKKGIGEAVRYASYFSENEILFEIKLSA